MEFPTLELGDGWGPLSGADISHGALYQPFSKADRIGKAADFVNGYRRDRFTTQAANKAQEQHKEFKLVDDTQVKTYGRRPQRKQIRRRYNNKDTAQQNLQRNRNLDRDRQRLEMRYMKKWKNTANRKEQQRTHKAISATFEVKPTWPLIKDVPVAKLSKDVPFEVPKPKDVFKAGSVKYLDRTLETTRPKMPVPVMLPKNRAPTFTPTASQDPVLVKYAEEGAADVFTTDDVLAYLMSASRAFYPFEILATKTNDVVFLDKRQGGPIDLASIDENALRPPMEADSGHINHPTRLNRELTALTRFYRNQTLEKDLKAESMGNPDPLKVNGPPNGYRYRLWVLPGGLRVMVRCQHDAICMEKSATGKTTRHFVAIKALLEYGVDMYKDGWRKQLETRKGSVLVSAMKDNSCLFSRWVVSSLLSGNKEIKVAFLSRRDPKVPTSHVVLNVETINTAQAAKEMGIKLNIGFGILMGFVHYLRQEEDDQYVIARSQKSLEMRRILEDEEESDEEEEEEEDDGVLDEEF